MTDQQRPGGYRGALPTRNDALARPWVVAVIVMFVLIFVLAFVGIPSKLLRASESPGPTIGPLPSVSASAGASASAAPSASSAGASASVAPSASDLVSPPPTE
ncbi:MAG TPA: hypothetical protein VH987_05080 [Candidatus Limnocylindria bacterium]|jgi:hypothetical protein